MSHGNGTEEEVFEKKRFQGRFEKANTGSKTDRNGELILVSVSVPVRQRVLTTGLVRTDDALNTRVSTEERNCKEGV